MPSDKLLCIYHANFTDGFGAAYAVWKANPTAEFYAGSYGSPPPDVMGRNVVIVDFSYKREVLEKMVTEAMQITVLDHHKTAQEDLRPLFDDKVIDGEFSMTQSGAVMAWNWFHTSPAPLLLRHIQDRDLWKFEMQDTREIILGLLSHSQTFSIWDAIIEEGDVGLEMLKSDGKAIKRYMDKQTRDVINIGKRMGRINGYLVPICSAPNFMASEIGNIMAQGHPFSATYCDTETGRTYSLRSSEDGVDVSAVAKVFGGGHKHAAGFKVTYDRLNALGDLEYVA